MLFYYCLNNNSIPKTIWNKAASYLKRFIERFKQYCEENLPSSDITTCFAEYIEVNTFFIIPNLIYWLRSLMKLLRIEKEIINY